MIHLLLKILTINKCNFCTSASKTWIALRQLRHRKWINTVEITNEWLPSFYRGSLGWQLGCRRSRLWSTRCRPRGRQSWQPSREENERNKKTWIWVLENLIHQFQLLCPGDATLVSSQKLKKYILIIKSLRYVKMVPQRRWQSGGKQRRARGWRSGHSRGRWGRRWGASAPDRSSSTKTWRGEVVNSCLNGKSSHC